MDFTITGAASGENVRKASPKGSQSQAKGQKSNECLFVILMDAEIGDTSLFFYCPYLGLLCGKVFFSDTQGICSSLCTYK